MPIYFQLGRIRIRIPEHTYSYSTIRNHLEGYSFLQDHFIDRKTKSTYIINLQEYLLKYTVTKTRKILLVYPYPTPYFKTEYSATWLGAKPYPSLK